MDIAIYFRELQYILRKVFFLKRDGFCLFICHLFVYCHCPCFTEQNDVRSPSLYVPRNERGTQMPRDQWSCRQSEWGRWPRVSWGPMVLTDVLIGAVLPRKSGMPIWISRKKALPDSQRVQVYFCFPVFFNFKSTRASRILV